MTKKYKIGSMVAENNDFFKKIVAVVVWYNPQKNFVDNILSYSKYVSRVYIIDNSKNDNTVLAEKIENAVYLPNFDNLGIATALNIGCEKALEEGFEWCMTMDQDSNFSEEMIEKYLKAIYEYRSEKNVSFAPSCIYKNSKPVIDSTVETIRLGLKKNKSLLAVKRKVFSKLNIYQDFSEKKETENVKRVITSGNVIHLHVWKDIGKFNENLFIDEVDFDYFRMMNPIERRSAYEICMLYHDDDRKRCADSIAALKIVKEKIPELHVNIFGTPKRPDDLPDWFSYFQLPDKDTHNRIYNDSAIFVAASKAEGMALPPAEAMICGAALCCTDIDGFALYAIDGETALASAVYDVAALAKNIEKLICDNDLRIKIAKHGNEFIKQFTWEKAVEKFETVLKSNFSD